MTSYMIKPTKLTFQQIKDKGVLSGMLYQDVIKNKNRLKIRSIVEEPVRGKEVGENAYVEKSSNYFIKNRAIRRFSYFPTGYLSYLSDGGQRGIVPIKPRSFIKADLKINDILYTKDSTLGESAIIESDNYSNHMFSSGILKLRVKNNPLYIFAFLKHEFLREQVIAMTAKGTILSHSGNNVLDCEIPFTKNKNKIRIVESLMNSLLIIESNIRIKHTHAVEIIQNNIEENQKDEIFHYDIPTFSEISERKRLDAALYAEQYKKFIFRIKNYKDGFITIEELGFKVKRGQNLQISAIGTSIYSKKNHDGYYVLVRPKDVSPFGTIDKIEYLGNKKKLDLIHEGDVMFGAEGTYRPTVFFDINKKNVITNIHGLIIYKEEPSVLDSALLCAYFWYLAKEGILADLSVGAHGGSVTQDYILKIPIPKFSDTIKSEITKCYYNQQLIHPYRMEDLGISQLDFKKIELSERLNILLDEIILEESV